MTTERLLADGACGRPRVLVEFVHETVALLPAFVAEPSAAVHLSCVALLLLSAWLLS